MATPANLPSGTVGCTAPPTNSPTKTILAPRNAKYVQRSPHVYNTHNIQITSSNNTIDEHPAQIWSPGHLPRQDQIRNYPKHTRQHIIHKNTSDKNHKPPQYLLLPEIWSSRQNNRSKFAQLWTPRHSWQDQINKYLKSKRQIITHKYICNKNHKPPLQTLLPPDTWFSLQNNRFEILRHLNNICHVDGGCASTHEDHLSTNVEILLASSQDIMFSSFPARFEAVAASLTASFPPAKIHFTGDYHSISQNCAQHGRSFVLLNNHFVSLGSLDGIQDLTHFTIPERITDIPQEYRSAFLLSNGSRDEEIQNLRSYELEVIAEVENLLSQVEIYSARVVVYTLRKGGYIS